ncbi:hypothetical protein OG840_59735 [Streptomyces sp. NBC_01764]|uniref:hypothetical protein n=1 Tax=Streptomyces sp. NBC_01764 TaxID=2975935 RepID=UPI00224F7E60|nr:hypothetical protein [Streptomyces sp. NBC_01764]MCX4411257.1 hypothetical protein [Streptomyces sp. NBC_01764]
MQLDYGKFGVSLPCITTARRYGRTADPFCNELVLDHGQDLEQLLYGVALVEYPFQDGLLVGVRLDLQNLSPGLFCVDSASVSVSEFLAPS